MPSVLTLLVFLSGVSGLLYEVLWAKALALHLGSTAVASTMVLCVFLGGLSLGYAVLGRVSDAVKDPLRLYGQLELAIAALGALSPALLRAAGSPWAGAFLPAWLACAAVLLAPAFLMGGTLPALTRRVSCGARGVGDAVSWLYFINSAGAAVGGVLSTFVLVPSLGLELSILAAAALNAVVGVAALRLADGGRAPSPVAPQPPEPPLERSQASLLAVAVFASGFVALAYEVAWIRLLAMTLGSSTHSFSLTLAGFITGIAAGSLLVARRVLPRLPALQLFGLAELGAALAVAATLPFYDRLPYWFIIAGGAARKSFWLHESIKYLFCAALMFVPTALLGMTLPLAGRAAAGSERRIGRGVGSIFAWNTLGNVLGAAAAGLFLLPLLGIRGLILAGVAVHAAVGLAVLRSIPGSLPPPAAAAAAAAALLCLWSRPWDLALLSRGDVRQAARVRAMSFAQYRDSVSLDALLYYKDDAEATVAVVRDPAGTLSLKINGKTDADTGSDMPTQMLLAHIPLLLKPEAKDVLLVGLGSGVTAGSALAHPIERLEVVEISAAVGEAAPLFAAHNRGALADPRLRLRIEDAKTRLRRSRERFDVIISEPSNPWMAGVAGLFTADFYRAARLRLSSGGVMAQWFHLYEMTDDTLRLVLRTFASQFPQVTLWAASGGDLILLGSEEPLGPTPGSIEAVVARGEVSRDLARIGLRAPADLLRLQLADDATVRVMAGRGRLHEDLYPILEYEAPKAFFLDQASSLAAEFDLRRDPSRARDLLLGRYRAGPPGRRGPP